MRVLPVSGTARAMSSGAAVLLLLFLTGFSAAPTAPANCTNCCPEPPCDSSPLPPLECTLDSGPDSGCTGMRYADSSGHYGPCTLNSASTRSCGCTPESGRQACLGAGVFGPCMVEGPSLEVCNGCDDDQDGVIDNIVPRACDTGSPGLCAEGRTACVNGAQACQPLRAPSAETCDGEDNDCDGQVDELGWLFCGTGDCSNTVPRCFGGAWQTCTPNPPSEEVCDGRDNDCDGVTDEGLGIVTCGQGACAHSVAACLGGQPQACVPLPPQVERCDGLDNDCDGAVDEDNACRFDSTSCGCTPVPVAVACADTACGTAPDGCGGHHACGKCPHPSP